MTSWMAVCSSSVAECFSRYAEPPAWKASKASALSPSMVEKNELGVDARGLEPAQRLEAARSRHVHVRDDDVGAEPDRRFNQLLSVPYAGEDLVIAVQQLAERFDDDGRVIGEDERGAAHRSMLQEPAH